MKKKIKYIAAAGAVLAMAMMLCSCKQLDEMKLNHAVYTEKGKVDTIEFRGKTYTLCEGKMDEEQSSLIVNDGDNLVAAWVTDPDVPILFSETRGKRIIFSDCGKEAPLYFEMNTPTEELESRTSIYCDTDHISEFKNMIENGKMDHLFLNYVEDYSDRMTSGDVSKLIPEDANSAIFRTIERPIDPATDYSKMADIKDVSPYFLEPQFCDQNLIFTNGQVIQIMRTDGTKKKYYIGYQQPYTDEWEDDGSLLNADWKLVDAKDTKAMDALFEEFRGSVYNINMYDGAMQYEQLTPLQ